MKKTILAALLYIFCITFYSCGSLSENSRVDVKGANAVSKFSGLAQQLMQNRGDNPLTITLTPETVDYYLPALHSYADAMYDGLWIIVGGQVVGFHGTSNNPPPFHTSFANDSLWVIDAVQGKSYGVPVPKAYWNALGVTNPQSYQVGSDLYMCGGYTVTDSTKTRFNTTSNFFFKINLPNLIAYVQSGGESPSLSAVFPIVINNNFVRAAGGELMVVNNNFYLIGGQDYEGVYSPGVTGKYTNAIRSFTLQQDGSTWQLANMDSLVDPINLHRRDFNLVPFIGSDNSVEAIIYGGVFTSNDLSFNNPIYIQGLSSRNPVITVGNSQQKCNQYTCAVAPMYFGKGEAMGYAMLGGISYMKYDTDSGRLVIGDYIGKFNVPMPFSNLVNFMITDGNTSIENVQIPPLPLLPKYIGSNASFMPLQQFTLDGFENILDLNKILSNTNSPIRVGFMYGGILSDGPTTGTTARGHINTYANPVLYSVNFTFDESKMKQ